MEVNPKFSVRAQEDLDLVDKAKQGDQQAFEKLMNRYRDSIFFMVLKMVHNRDDALEEFRTSLSIDPKNKSAREALAEYTNVYGEPKAPTPPS